MAKSNKGFSAIEALISLAIIGVASTALMDMMRGFSVASAETERKAEIQSMSGSIQMSLSNGGDCLSNLRDASKTSMTLDTAAAASLAGQPLSINLKDAAGTVLAENKPNTIYPKIMPTTIRLKDLQPVNGSANTYTGNVWVAAVPTTADKTLSQYHERNVMSVFLTTDASNKLKSCYATGGSDFNGFCASMGGVWDTAALKCNLSPQKECEDVGGTWIAPVSPATVGQCTMDSSKSCASLGGSWSGSSCVINTINPSTACTTLGGTMVGSACHLPDKTCPVANGQTSGSFQNSAISHPSTYIATTTTNTYTCVDGTWLLTGSSSSSIDSTPAVTVTEPPEHGGATGEH